MGNSSSTTGLRGQAGRLDAGEVLRLRSAVDSEICRAAAERPADWSAVQGDGLQCEIAPLDDPDMKQAIAAALSGLGIEGDVSLVLLRHGPGAHGLPAGEGAAALVDLTDGRSFHGGLILTGDAPMEGWRPETGAMTVFDGARPPLLTLVVETAPTPRLSVLARVA